MLLYGIVTTLLNTEIIDYNQQILDRKFISSDDTINYYNAVSYKQLLNELEYQIF